MACAGLQNQNSFGLFDTLDIPPPNELSQVFSQRNSLKKCTPQDPTPFTIKTQQHVEQRCALQPPCNPVSRQNGNRKPLSSTTRGRDNIRLDKGSGYPPAPIPPRFQNKIVESTFASLWSCPTPRPCSGVIDPCLTATSPCSGNELLNMQLKQQVFMALQSPPPAIPVSMFQPIPAPIAPTKSTSSPASIPYRSNQSKAEQDNVNLSSTPTQHTVGCEKLYKPKVVLPTSTSTRAPIPPATFSDESLPAPPGLPRPSGRGRRDNRIRPLMKPAYGEPRFDQVIDQSYFERYNGPISASLMFSPLPSRTTSPTVKLPSSKDTQHVPPSPTITVSSLSEDLSGGSSVHFSSDTTFTSVGSSVSDKLSLSRKISDKTCWSWEKGLPCRLDPCPFLHPPRPNQVSKTLRSLEQHCELFSQFVSRATQPTHPPRGTCAAKSSLGVCDQEKNGIPRKHDLPTEDVEPPQRPEPLYATTISDHIKVRFDHGFEVREVMTGFESRWVHLSNVDGAVTPVALHELLGAYKVDTVNMPELPLAGKVVTVKVQFTSVADAMKAVMDLNGIKLGKRMISAKLAINNSKRGSTVLTNTDAQIVWECPSRVGYVGYDTLKEAKAAIDSLDGSTMEYLVLSVQLYEGLPCVGAYNVIFKQLPASVTEQDLRKLANSKSVMLGRPNYLSLEKAVKSIRSKLEEYGTVTSFDVIPPPYYHGLVKAWARFTSPAEARAAQDDLDHRRPKVIGHTTISCRHVVSVSHVLSAASYKKMREDIGWLRLSWQHRYGPGISIREKVKDNAEDAPVFIRLTSEQSELLSALKYEFEQLLHGETITLERKPLWDDFLITEAGYAYIDQMRAQYPGIQIQVQKNRRVISLWGPITMRHRARQDIVRKIVELKAQQFWEIPLSGRLLTVFCSAELSTLQELLGPENCILDFEKRVLVVRGNDRAFRTACKAVQDAQSRQNDGTSSSGAICPVCFGEAVVPVSLACGHRWCRACLTGYLISAVENKTFPLRCLGNDATCTQCVPLSLSRKLLSAADFEAVIEAAFWVYVHSRPDEFHNCPTPDCTQVYRSAPPNAVLQCPSCLVRICPACRIEYHDGMTCEERDVAEDKLFNEWTSNHDVKSCPGCRAPIERSEGCNHMTCTRCQTHICWVCLTTFPKGQGIYDHMRIKHGGIGL